MGAWMPSFAAARESAPLTVRGVVVWDWKPIKADPS
jgi:hypothetical protein